MLNRLINVKFVIDKSFENVAMRRISYGNVERSLSLCILFAIIHVKIKQPADKDYIIQAHCHFQRRFSILGNKLKVNSWSPHDYIKKLEIWVLYCDMDEPISWFRVYFIDVEILIINQLRKFVDRSLFC